MLSLACWKIRFYIYEIKTYINVIKFCDRVICQWKCFIFFQENEVNVGSDDTDFEERLKIKGKLFEIKIKFLMYIFSEYGAI